MANTITRKALSLALIANIQSDTNELFALAEHFGTDTETIADALTAWAKTLNRPRKSKPSAETLANRKLAEDVAAEVIARGIEVTAKDVAEYATDADGMPMSSRKVGALLRNAAAQGLIAKSPYNWSPAHYAPVGFEFAPKPERKKKSKKVEETEE